jgi:hypothetical protein
MKFIIFLLLPFFINASELIQMPGGSLRTPDIAISRIYPEATPLNLVYIHPYNPSHNCVIGVRVRDIETPFEGRQDVEFFLLINRFMGDSDPLLRPHYWISRETGGIINISANVRVVSAQGGVLLSGSHNVNAHDLVCSPSNMGFPLDMALEKSHLLYSMVEDMHGKKAVTCHWIPSEPQWEAIWASEFFATPSANTHILLERLSAMFEGDANFEIVRKILERFNS